MNGRPFPVPRGTSSDRHREATHFYEAILQVTADRSVPSRYYYHCGDAILVTSSEEHGPSQIQTDTADIYLAVDDLEAMYERAISAGAARYAEPGNEGWNGIMRRVWGERNFYCRDPFGNPLCFVEHGTEHVGVRPR